MAFNPGERRDKDGKWSGGGGGGGSGKKSSLFSTKAPKRMSSRAMAKAGIVPPNKIYPGMPGFAGAMDKGRVPAKAHNGSVVHTAPAAARHAGAVHAGKVAVAVAMKRSGARRGSQLRASTDSLGNFVHPTKQSLSVRSANIAASHKKKR